MFKNIRINASNALFALTVFPDETTLARVAVEKNSNDATAVERTGICDELTHRLECVRQAVSRATPLFIRRRKAAPLFGYHRSPKTDAHLLFLLTKTGQLHRLRFVRPLVVLFERY